ncbi:MAG: hypothetical protein WAK20_07930 [Candidatus Acidiferrum sp.]
MKKIATIAAMGLLAGATFSLAGQKPSIGTIVSETSVSCGTKKQGKKESTDLMCQQYKMQSAGNEYLIRQQKAQNVEIIPPNTSIEYTIDKNKIKFKANGKKYEYLVVGTSTIGNPAN